MLNFVKNNSMKAGAGIVLAIAGNTLAVEAVKANEDVILDQVNQYNEQVTPMSQVTSVNQLRDVSPTDWSYEALRSLVERYGCIVGYPDGTFRGNRALSRNEFAAGLNACMQQMERLIAASEAVLQEDIAKLQRLMKEFEAELAALGARVDNLEGRVAFLEDHQFSTTTKLKGEVILALVTGTGNEIDATGRTPQDGGIQAILANRVRLTFDTSFSGKDNLRLRLNSSNGPDIDGGAELSEMASVSFQGGSVADANNLVLDKAYYETPVGDKATLFVGAVFEQSDVFKSYSKFTQSSGTGSLSRALRYDPFVFRQADGAGAGLTYKFNDKFDVAATYIAAGTNGQNPSDEAGLFDGSYSAGIQFGFHPTKTLDLGIAYLRNYSNRGGSVLDPTGGLSDAEGDDLFNRDFSSDNVSFQFGWKAAKKLNIAGWVGFSFVEGENPDFRGNADLINWSLNASILDLGKEGAVGTIAIGQAPYITSFSGVTNQGQAGVDPDPNFIIEGNYKYPVTKNISLTPGVYAIFNPENESDRSTVVVGVIRTVFQF